MYSSNGYTNLLGLYQYFRHVASESTVWQTIYWNHISATSQSNTITMCEICLHFTINTPEPRYWRRSRVFIVNFRFYIVVSIADFENVGWPMTHEMLWDLHLGSSPIFTSNIKRILAN